MGRVKKYYQSVFRASGWFEQRFYFANVKLVSLQSIFPAVLEFYPLPCFMLSSASPSISVYNNMQLWARIILYWLHLCAQVLLAVYLLYNCSVFWWVTLIWSELIFHYTQTSDMYNHLHTLICIIYASIRSGFLWPWLSAEWSIAFQGGWLRQRRLCRYRLVPRAPCVGEIQGPPLSAMNHRLVLAFWLTMSEYLQSPQLLHDFYRVKVKSKWPHLTALVQSWIWCSGVLRICRAGFALGTRSAWRLLKLVRDRFGTREGWTA